MRIGTVKYLGEWNESNCSKQIRKFDLWNKDDLYSKGIKPDSLLSSMKLTCLFAIFLTIFAQIPTTNYFKNLPIDSNLMTQANSAVNNLLAFLKMNFQCPGDTSSQPSFQFQGYFNTQNAYLPSLPSVGQLNFGSCIAKPAYGLSLTVNCYTPISTCFTDMSLIPATQKSTLYNQLRNIISLLSQIKAALKQAGVNNAIVGSYNSVNGNGNIVIGSKDNVNGNNNWVFTSNYNSPDAQDGVLVLGSFMIQLNNYSQVTSDPSKVISCVGTQEAAKLFSAFWTNTAPARRYCM